MVKIKKRNRNRQRAIQIRTLTALSLQVACYECGFVEHSYEDNQLCEDWIQCCEAGCNIWCHESCGEKSGLLDKKKIIIYSFISKTRQNAGNIEICSCRQSKFSSTVNTHHYTKHDLKSYNLLSDCVYLVTDDCELVYEGYNN